MLVKKCSAEGLRVVVVGRSDTPRFLEGVEYFTADDVLRLLRIISYAKVAMTPDSATAHIAAGYGIPMLVWVPEDREGNVLYPIPGNEVVFPTTEQSNIVSAAQRILRGNSPPPSLPKVDPYNSPFTGLWETTHYNWQDALDVKPNGKFGRLSNTDCGIWTQEGDVLRLRWDYSGEERASIIDGKLVGRRFKGEKREMSTWRHTAVYRVDYSNIGDAVCAPWKWFSLTPSKIVDITPIQQRPEGTIIVGGGGLLYYREQIKRVVGDGKGVIVWGLGMNSEKRQADLLPQWLSSCDLVGVRDWVPGWRWVPCPSCMSPLFDEKWKIEHDIVVYEHKHRRISIDLPKMSNDIRSMREAISFLGSGDTVITNSYHGAYWASLLGRKAVLWMPWSSKFSYTKYKYPICEEVSPSALKSAFQIPGFLEESREANKAFYRDVLTVCPNDDPGK
jgi:hypothetical protein